MAADFVRLLHISDLHFHAAPFGPLIDDKLKFSSVKKPVAETPDVAFRRMLKDYLKKIPEAAWPSAVLVTGDVVDMGGTDNAGSIDEYSRAREFLRELS